MKKWILLLIVFKTMTLSAQNQLFIENQSVKDFTATVEWLNAQAIENNWKVIAIHDLQESMDKAGFSVVPVKVFSICKPEIAMKILGKSDERILSAMMPCRVSVYEKSDGRTYISRINTDQMASAFDGTMREVMLSTGQEIEDLISPILIK